MEIMQQSANHLDGRWRSHLLPYSGHAVSTIPNLHSHLRQQMISQQPDPQQHPLLQQHSGSSGEHLQQQQQQQQQQHQLHPSHQQQQMRQQQMSSQMQHRQVIVEHQQRRDPSSSNTTSSSPSSSSLSPTKDLPHHHHPLRASGSKTITSPNGLPSPSLHLNSLTLQSSPSSASPSTPSTPSPSTPSPGKSGGKDGEEKKGEEWEQYNAGAAFLGPTLWDKTLSYDADLKVSLEYMDLDEFLNENGIPVDESKRAGNNTTTGGVNGNVGIPSGNSLRAAQSPEAPSSPEASSPPMGSGMGACPQGAGVSAGIGAPATSGGALSVAPPALSPQDYVGDCSSSVSSPGSPDPLSPLQVPEPESARASQGRDIVAATGRELNEKFLGSASSARATVLPSAALDLKSEVLLEYNISPNDLALATVPGQDFDPRTRCFSEEELKPQPMIKKSRKQFVPVEMKDEKYWARRRKNNLAAKRSRDARRLKENQIAMRANFLEKENNAMTVELQKAQAIVESLKKRLAMYEAV